MAKKMAQVDSLDNDIMEDVVPVIDESTNEMYTENRQVIYGDNRPKLKNCLSNQTIKVSFIKRETPLVKNKNHILYGGKSANAYIHLCVPLLKNGHYVNVLTKDEKDYLEYIMGLPNNALSVFKKENNYWDNYKIVLTTEGIRLKLDNPEDYIKYKVLLANKSKVCPSRAEFERNPKSEYEFIIEDEQEATKVEARKISLVTKAYRLLDKNFDNKETLKTILSILTTANIDSNTTIEFIQSRLNELIQKDAKRFIDVAEDEYLIYKVLVRKAHEAKLLSNRGGFYYLKSDGTPLAPKGQDPDITNAAIFLSKPENSELKFKLEAEIDRINESNRF